MKKEWYRPDVDGLRAVAVLAVIVNHFSPSMLPNGFLGVDIFFVISGYVITTSIRNHSDNSFRGLFFAFYSRRVKRLLPALIVCVLLTCFVGSFFMSPDEPEYRSSLNAGTASLFGLSNISFYEESLDYFGASAKLNLFTHTWSLGVEEQFYFFFPALVWITGGATQRSWGARHHLFEALAILSLVSFAGYAWFVPGSKDAYYLMPYRFWELGVGCMIAVRPLVQVSSVIQRYARWLAFIGISVALVVPALGELNATAAIVISTAVLISTIVPNHFLFRLLMGQPFLMIGLMSYSLYLWHWPVLAISRWTIGVDWWSSPFQIAVTFALASISYQFIEQPLRKANWTNSNLSTMGLGLGAAACCGALLLVLRYVAFGALYTGEPARLEAKGIETLMQEKWYQGELLWSPQKCILTAAADVGKQIVGDICTLKTRIAAADRRFVVIGNSFSVAEFEMYSVLSENGLGTVIATSSFGASPIQEIPNRSQWSEANHYYWTTVVPALVEPMSHGDVLVMINDLSDFAPATMSQEVANQLSVLEVGLDRLSRTMAAKGVQLIFQAQNPLIRDAECPPDKGKMQWYNSQSTRRCHYYSKTETIRRLLPLRQVLDQVRSNRNFHVLDLLSVMCPGDLCTLQNDEGVFLYRDIFSHPSIEANRLARPLFLSSVEEATTHDALQAR